MASYYAKTMWMHFTYRFSAFSEFVNLTFLTAYSSTFTIQDVTKISALILTGNSTHQLQQLF
jgi:hypothetical protein